MPAGRPIQRSDVTSPRRPAAPDDSVAFGAEFERRGASLTSTERTGTVRLAIANAVPQRALGKRSVGPRAGGAGWMGCDDPHVHHSDLVVGISQGLELDAIATTPARS